MSDTQLQGADLEYANLRGADLRRVTLQRANLMSASFKEAYLMAIDLRGANLAGTNLGDAHLRGGDLSKSICADGTVRPDQFVPPRDLSQDMRWLCQRDGHACRAVGLAQCLQ